MCHLERRCPTLGFDQLRAFTHAVTSDPRWGSRTVRVGELAGHAAYLATTTGNVVRYRASAPACTVPHELAHVRSGDLGHGPGWQRAYIELLGWLMPPR